MSTTITPWENLSQHYIREIKNASYIFQKSKNLIQRISESDAGEAGKKLKQLTGQLENLERTRKRLEQGEFRIAVVGLEKAGKSTFVNAWLGYDLLPSNTSRCTFTTTQVFSVINSHEQRLIIHTKSQDEFDTYLHELKTLATSGAEGAKEDLELIEKNRTSLESVIRTGERTIMFSELSDIKEELDKYVASPENAHAVREAHLYTNRLAAADGLVFYDVPGLNSGLGKHIDESREMLKDCDAIICIQRSKTPSLEASEQKLIEFARTGDAQVSLADKLFVFLGQIDIEGSTKSLNDNIEKAYKEWHDRANLPRNHLVSGTAAGHLMMKGAASKNLLDQVGTQEKMQRALKELRGAQTQQELLDACGIQSLKDQVEHYLQYERGHVLSARCDKTLQNIKELSSMLFNEVKKRYPDDPALAERKAEETRRIELNKWWRERWDKAKRTAYKRCEELIIEGVSLKELHDLYTKEVNQIFTELHNRHPQQRDLIFDARGDRDPIGINIEWRARLRIETQQAISHLASKLMGGFLHEMKSLMSTFKEQLWESDVVTQELLGDIEGFERRITHGLETLFLRFTLPIIDVFIQHPVGTDSRQALIKSSIRDLEIADEYHDGDEPALKQIKLIAKYGFELISHPLLRQAILRIPVKIMPKDNEIFRKEDYPKIAKSKAEVIEEVEGDLKIVERYLIESIFSASGLTGYFRQELSRLRDRFMSPQLEDVARAVMDGLYHERNPRLMSELPATLRVTGVNIDISEALKELRESLSKGVL